jgi:hypothetical protein
LASSLIFFSRNHRIDNRTHRDCTERQQKLFGEQIEAITNAYMAWSHNAAHGITPDAGLPSKDKEYAITIVDVFGA